MSGSQLAGLIYSSYFYFNKRLIWDEGIGDFLRMEISIFEYLHDKSAI